MENIISKFRKYIVLYNSIEHNIINLAVKSFPGIKIYKKHMNSIECFEKNYLSIFFLMIYNKLHLNKNKIFFYGSINYLIRGIVTCTDNLLDNEEKFLLNVKNINPDASKSQSIFLIILYQNLLDSYLDISIKNKLITIENKRKIKKILFSELFEIGFIESVEEKKIKKFYHLLKS